MKGNWNIDDSPLIDMELPFTPEQFFDVFARYNEDLPAARIALSGLGLVAVLAAIIRYERTSLLILSVLWLWAGTVYHLVYFSPINPAAKVFGALFILQGLLFFWAFANRKAISCRPFEGANKYTGAFLIFFSIVVYPAIGWGLGHSFPRAPTFGLPCPLTIFTFGMLLWFRGKVPIYLVAISLIWVVIGSTAAVFLGVWQDLSLPIAATVTVILLLRASHLENRATVS